MFVIHRCFITAKTGGSIFCQQVAHYLPPPLPVIVSKRLEDHRRVVAKDNEDLHPNQKLWARVGSKSGVNPSTFFATREDIMKETAAEKEWWPTLQEMQHNIAEAKEIKNREEIERKAKIADNMSKMPKWIAEFQKEEQQNTEKMETNLKKRQIEEDKVREIFGFDLPRNHPMLKLYLERSRERSKKEKKLASKQAYKEKLEQVGKM